MFFVETPLCISRNRQSTDNALMAFYISYFHSIHAHDSDASLVCAGRFASISSTRRGWICTYVLSKMFPLLVCTLKTLRSISWEALEYQSSPYCFHTAVSKHSLFRFVDFAILANLRILVCTLALSTSHILQKELLAQICVPIIRYAAAYVGASILRRPENAHEVIQLIFALRCFHRLRLHGLGNRLQVSRCCQINQNKDNSGI